MAISSIITTFSASFLVRKNMERLASLSNHLMIGEVKSFTTFRHCNSKNKLFATSARGEKPVNELVDFT